jgi:hypothetical protein
MVAAAPKATPRNTEPSSRARIAGWAAGIKDARKWVRVGLPRGFVDKSDKSLLAGYSNDVRTPNGQIMLLPVIKLDRARKIATYMMQ